MRISIGPDIESTSVPITWCLSREEKDKIVEDDGRDAYVLLLTVVEDRPKAENRYLIPIKQQMEYINFFTPGVHKVFATIVLGKLKRLSKTFLDKDYGSYSHTLYSYESEKGSIRELSFDDDGFGVHKFEVNIPKEIFAKEPPAWEKYWVNWFFENKPKDQCYFRRRRFFAYSLQPFVVLGGFMFLEFLSLVITSALLLWGCKGIGFRKILHPFSEDFESIWNETKGSIFGERLILRLVPSVFLGVSVISGITFKMVGCQFSSFGFGYQGIITAGAIVAAMAALTATFYYGFVGFIKIIGKIRDALVPNLKERRKQRVFLQELEEERKRKEWLEKMQAEYESLVCDGKSLPNIKDLPLAKRTIHLRYQNLKSRWCKSFAR